ncbi:MAG: hypothetical protein OEU26_06600, partial [Candidatus Tectomicrobia bacterium]|nr:hypothetical protein [Candidatus Tectomicrobia bacterium]
MTRAIFHPAARRELEETIDHYNAERQGLRRALREEVHLVLDLLGASSMCAMAHTKYTPEALLS